MKIQCGVVCIILSHIYMLYNYSKCLQLFYTKTAGIHFSVITRQFSLQCSTVEPPNSGHVGDKCFVHYSEVVPSFGGSNMRTVVGRGDAVCPL